MADCNCVGQYESKANWKREHRAGSQTHLFSSGKRLPLETGPMDWIKDAYPLKRITIELQGTPYSELGSLVNQLDEIKQKVLDGCTSGCDCDDDFGYRVTVSQSESEFDLWRPGVLE